MGLVALRARALRAHAFLGALHAPAPSIAASHNFTFSENSIVHFQLIFVVKYNIRQFEFHVINTLISRCPCSMQVYIWHYSINKI